MKKRDETLIQVYSIAIIISMKAFVYKLNKKEYE